MAGTMPNAVQRRAASFSPTDASLVSALQRAARNAAWLFSSQSLMRLIGFAMGTLLARLLGAEQFGLYMFVMAYVTYFAFLADAGLGRYLIRDAAREPGRAQEYLAKVGALRLLLAAAVYLLLIVGALVTRAGGERTAYIVVAGLSLFAGAVSGALCSMFNAREQMRITALFQVLSTTLTALFVIAALVAGFGLPGVFVGAALANLPPVGLLVYQWQQQEGWPGLTVDPLFWRVALRRSFPYALLSIIGLVYFRMDSLLLTWMVGAEANGIYTAAYRLLDAVTDIPGVIVAAMFPTLARLHVESREQLRRTYLGAVTLLAALGVPVLIGILLLARPIVLLLYGEEFAESAIILQILALAVFLIFVDTANTMVLYAGENLRPVVALSLVTMSANIVLCLVLIPRYEERGAAVATVISSAVSLAIFTPVVLRSLRR